MVFVLSTHQLQDAHRDAPTFPGPDHVSHCSFKPSTPIPTAMVPLFRASMAPTKPGEKDKRMSSSPGKFPLTKTPRYYIIAVSKNCRAACCRKGWGCNRSKMGAYHDFTTIQLQATPSLPCLMNSIPVRLPADIQSRTALDRGSTLSIVIGSPRTISLRHSFLDKCPKQEASDKTQILRRIV